MKDEDAEGQFDFWQDHSTTFLSMAYLWERRKPMPMPDGYGTKTGDCGDTISMYLSIRCERIAAITFELQGCINTSACCNALAVLAEGRTVVEGWEVAPRDVIDFLETLPDDHHHCAELAVGTFYLALADYNERKKGEAAAAG